MGGSYLHQEGQYCNLVFGVLGLFRVLFLMYYVHLVRGERDGERIWGETWTTLLA